MVTITIRQGDPFVYELLDYTLQPIGRVVRRGTAIGLEQHQIIALVKTMRKRFVSQVTYIDGKRRPLLIRLTMAYSSTITDFFLMITLYEIVTLAQI